MDPHDKLRSQIRAGRELLGITRADFASKLGVSLSKISRAESGETKSGDVLLLFKGELEKMGIRFTANGVEIIENILEVIEGKGCYLKLLDDIFLTLKNSNDKEFLILFASDKVSPPEVNAKYRMMRNAGISMKQIIEQGDNYIMGDLEEYRAIPSKYFVNIVTVVYSNKVAQVNSSETRITIQNDENLARREKKLFQYYWDTGVRPTESIATERF